MRFSMLHLRNHKGGSHSQGDRWWQNSHWQWWRLLTSPDKNIVKSNERVTLHAITHSLHEPLFPHTYNSNYQASKYIPVLQKVHYHIEMCRNVIGNFHGLYPWSTLHEIWHSRYRNQMQACRTQTRKSNIKKPSTDSSHMNSNDNLDHLFVCIVYV